MDTAIGCIIAPSPDPKAHQMGAAQSLNLLLSLLYSLLFIRQL
jgi:hypothetical protein